MTDIVLDDRETVAKMTGVAVDRIGIVRLQLNKLLSEGILINLDISGEGMFMKQADWSEIGIQVGEIRSSRLTRGQKYLISEQRIKNLRTVTTRMRQWLEKLTVDITGFRPYRYLNYKRHLEWTEKWAELTKEFVAAKQDILDNYETDIEDLKKDYEEIADLSWRSMKALGCDEIDYDGQRFTDKNEFTQRMIQKVLSKVPSMEKIAQGLTADYSVSILQGQEQIEEHYLKSEKIRAEAEVVRAQAEAKIAIEKAKLNAKLDEEYAQAKLLQEQERHETEMNFLAEQEKQAAIHAMIKAEADHIRQQFADQIAPIEQVFTQLRKEMAEICLDAAESVKKNGYVRGKTAEKLRGLVEFYQLSSIQEDPVLLQKLQELRKAVGPVGDERTKDMPERSPEEVIGALNQVIDLQNTVKQDLTLGPSRISLID